MFRTAGFPGLKEGLETIEIIFKEYWEQSYPPVSRLAARKNSLEWMNLRVGEQVEAGGSFSADWYLLTALDELLKNLVALIGEKFGAEPPSISAITRAVQTRLKSTKPPAQPAAPGAATAAVDEGITSDSQAEELSGKVSDYYFAQSPQSMIAHRLPRLMRWGGLENEPPNERGKTMLPPPRPNLRIELDNLVGSSNWPDLLTRTREMFFEDACHFWLDLGRFADQALEGLGSEVQPLRTALQRDLGGLVERIPKLPELMFSDGTPFADDTTRKWIEGTVRASLASGASPSGALQKQA